MISRKPRGYWRDIRNVIKEARRVKRENGLESFPSSTESKKLGISGLVDAIYKYHGGMQAFRIVLGEEQKKGSWKSKTDDANAY